MKHLHTFENFVAQLNEWKKPKVEDLVHDMKVKITRGRHAGATGAIHDFQLTDKGDLVDDRIDVLVDRPGKPFAYLGLADIMVESFLSEGADESVNEGNNFQKFDDLKIAISHHEDGNPYYDKTKLVNMFNQLSSTDQAKARKEYGEYFGVGK